MGIDFVVVVVVLLILVAELGHCFAAPEMPEKVKREGAEGAVSALLLRLQSKVCASAERAMFAKVSIRWVPWYS